MIGRRHIVGALYGFLIAIAVAACATIVPEEMWYFESEHQFTASADDAWETTLTVARANGSVVSQNDTERSLTMRYEARLRPESRNAVTVLSVSTVTFRLSDGTALLSFADWELPDRAYTDEYHDAASRVAILFGTFYENALNGR